MAKACIVRTGAPVPPPGPVLDAVRSFLFECFRGLRDEDEKTWRRAWKMFISLDPGELANIEIIFPRNSRLHRKFFAMLNVGFEAWEPGRKHKTHKGIPVVKSFENFREDVLIIAGFYDQSFDLDGRMKLVAKSISFAKMDDAQFEAVYSAVADVLLDRVLTAYRGRDELDEVVDKILGFVK